MLQLEIYGRPVTSNSHKKNKYGAIYDPKKEEKDKAKWQVKSQFNQKPYGCAVQLDITYYFHIPKNTSFIKKKQMLANIIKHTSYPDTDRLTNFLKDVLAGIVFENDKQVWRETPQKLWCEHESEEKTLIYVHPDVYEKACK